jgi:Zn-dependent protease
MVPILPVKFYTRTGVKSSTGEYLEINSIGEGLYMRRSLTFGHVAGVPLRIHVNWFFIAALVTWSLAAGYFPQEYPTWGDITYWLVGLVTASFFFASVLAHELAHAIVAQQEGIPVRSITLFILGGVAHIGHEPETAESEFKIVAAGPGISLVLAGAFYLIHLVTGFLPIASAVALYLFQINVILAVFNLIPGFPLDGGRILRSFVWKITNDFFRATRFARSSGLFVAFLFILVAAALSLKGNYFSGLWIGFIGLYLGNAAQESYRQVMPEKSKEPASAIRVVEERSQPQPRYSGEL